jgi:hypothetical protein
MHHIVSAYLSLQMNDNIYLHILIDPIYFLMLCILGIIIYLISIVKMKAVCLFENFDDGAHQPDYTAALATKNAL